MSEHPVPKSLDELEERLLFLDTTPQENVNNAMLVSTLQLLLQAVSQQARQMSRAPHLTRADVEKTLADKMPALVKTEVEAYLATPVQANVALGHHAPDAGKGQDDKASPGKK